jgi:hypothetical protein
VPTRTLDVPNNGPSEEPALSPAPETLIPTTETTMSDTAESTGTPVPSTGSTLELSDVPSNAPISTLDVPNNGPSEEPALSPAPETLAPMIETTMSDTAESTGTPVPSTGSTLELSDVLRE